MVLHATCALQYVLYGVFPAVAVGAGATALYIKHKMHAADKFKDVAPGTKLKSIHKFSCVGKPWVERLQ